MFCGLSAVSLSFEAKELNQKEMDGYKKLRSTLICRSLAKYICSPNNSTFADTFLKIYRQFPG